MNMDAVPAETRVNPFGRPRFFPGGPEAVLIIHGFTGRTSEMVYLATELNNHGYTVSVPRLPGHGTNGRDFLQSDGDQWLRHAVDTYLDLRAEYERVYVVGLSMGGVIASIIAARFGPDAVALCAPALLLRRRNIVLTPLVGAFVARWRIPYEPDSDDPVEQELQREYYAYQWVRPASELYRLMRRARRELQRITAPTLTVISERDGMVPPKVADYVETHVGTSTVKRLHLTESDHIVVNDVDRETVAAEIRAWFATTRAPATTAGERIP